MLKVLCLHGYGTNADFLEIQTRNFQKYFKNIFKFHYMDAPALIDNKSDYFFDPVVFKILQQHGKNTNLYNWIGIKEKLDFKQMVKESLNYIINYMNTYGPFDAVMGFSQGGRMAHLLVDSIEAGLVNLVHERPKVFIFCCAPVSYNMETFLTDDVYKINKTPSIFLIGKKDALYSGILPMTTKYLDPLVIEYQEGHKFPILRQDDIENIESYLKGILKQKKKQLKLKAKL